MTAVLSDRRIADKLDEAADYLEGYGWRRHDSGKDGGRRCATGAIESVLKGERRKDDKFSAIIQRTEELFPLILDENENEAFPMVWIWATGKTERRPSIVHYNDAQTDKRKVVRMLRRAARTLRGV